MTAISALQNQVVVPSNVATEDTTEQDEIDQQRIEFLDILITQLQNQNPLDPMDTDEYTNQLIQYSQLDQQLEIKAGVEELNETFKAQNSMSALSYLGETVELTTNAAPVEDGVATWNYLYKGDAKEVNIQVLDENGDMIYEEEGSKIQNTVHRFTFDAAAEGIEDGTAVFIKIYAKDSEGENLDSGVTSFATVDGITGDGSNPYMTSGAVTFSIADILKTTSGQPQATTAITANTDDTDSDS